MLQALPLRDLALATLTRMEEFTGLERYQNRQKFLVNQLHNQL